MKIDKKFSYVQKSEISGPLECNNYLKIKIQEREKYEFNKK